MSARERLRCFGGPAHGNMVRVADDAESVEVLIPEMLRPLFQVAPLTETAGVMSPSIVETVRYDVRRLQFHDDHPARCRCTRDDLQVLPAPCVREYRFLVRPGHHERTVVDAVRALTAITYALHSRTRRVAETFAEVYRRGVVDADEIRRHYHNQWVPERPVYIVHSPVGFTVDDVARILGRAAGRAPTDTAPPTPPRSNGPLTAGCSHPQHGTPAWTPSQASTPSTGHPTRREANAAGAATPQRRPPTSGSAPAAATTSPPTSTDERCTTPTCVYSHPLYDSALLEGLCARGS